jgi:hypothetical protein
MIRFQPLVAGAPLPGGKVYFYAAGTTTPQAAYAADGTTPLANPLTLDANGATYFLLSDTLTYKIDLTDSIGTPVTGWPVDQITSFNAGFVLSVKKTDLAATGTGQGAGMVGYKAPFTGAVATTQNQVNTEFISVFRWFTAAQIADVIAGTLTLDVTAAVQSAINGVLLRGGTLWFPKGFYKITGMLSVGASRYTLADYTSRATRTLPMGAPTPNATNDAANRANCQAINLEFSSGAFLVASWTPSVLTPVIEHNLEMYLGKGTVKGLRIITPYLMDGTRYNWGNTTANSVGGPYFPVDAQTFVPPTNNLLGIVFGQGLASIQDVEFSGLQVGMLGVSPYWTSIKNVVGHFCGDIVNLSEANASQISNIEAWYSGRGLVIDGDVFQVDGLNTEQCLDDLVILGMDCATLKNCYLEDTTTATNGTGHAAVTIGQTTGLTCHQSMLDGIKVGTTRPNKLAFNINNSATNNTYSNCRAFSNPVSFGTSSSGVMINSDFAAPQNGKWSAIGMGCSITENNTGSARVKIGKYIFAYSATLANISADSYVSATLPIGVMPPSYGYITCQCQAVSGTDLRIVAQARASQPASGTGSITGSVMTITSGSGFAVGQMISYPGAPANLTISSLGTGSGGTGTYNLSASVTATGTIAITTNQLTIYFQNTSSATITAPYVSIVIDTEVWL